uniref:Beta-amylase n=1 Tax=Physcomitrium patens TaxID=3218 RepID=A0A7I4FDT5_PHYPA
MSIGEAEHAECPSPVTPYIPTYVMLPLSTISNENKVADPEKLKEDLDKLKRASVDGVMIDCWWGIVEGVTPQVYDWSAYYDLFSMVRDCKLKLQAIMSFHQCGGNVGDDVFIPLPAWVLRVGKENPDIFFTNRAGVRNPESLTFGIDDEAVLDSRTALEVYYDFMESFRKDMQEFLEDGTITEIEVGMGPCGELRYPSYPETQGWKYPGTGEFQCWDKYLLKNLKNAANEKEHPEWGVGPADAGDYNCTPHNSAFFEEGRKSPYGEFFLDWYSRALIEHGDNLLTVARHALGNTKLAVKVTFSTNSARNDFHQFQHIWIIIRG